jgi:hypothetical protein
MINLTDDNFNLFAAKYYINHRCINHEEFEEDLKRIRYIKRLLRKYKQTEELKVRLVLNHFVILYNVFDAQALTRMLCLKLSDELDMVKPFLIFLGYWPDVIVGINGRDIRDSDISLNDDIVYRLREFNTNGQ